MQILLSMTISTLKLYGRKQPMRPWSLFNSFQRIGKGTLQLSHLNSLVQSKCPQQSVLSLMDALSGLHCGSGSVPSSAGRSLALSSCTVCDYWHRLWWQICTCSYNSISSASAADVLWLCLTMWTSIGSLIPDVLQIFVIFACCESSYIKTVSILGQIIIMLASVKLQLRWFPVWLKDVCPSHGGNAMKYVKSNRAGRADKVIKML